MTTDMDGAGQDGGADTSILLAEGQAIVRAAVRRVLEAAPALSVVGEAGDVTGLLRKVMAYKPPVLILALNLPGGSSLEAIPRVREISPGTRTIVLTTDGSARAARAALRAGAAGFVPKQAPEEELIEAVRVVAAGRRYLDPELGVRVVTEPERPAKADGLTARELEVLKLIALGYTNTEIADRLFLSIRTVEAHRSHLQHKIHTRTRAEVSAYAREISLVDSAQ